MSPHDLDTRIVQIEQRLVAREAWLRSTAQSLSQRTHHAVASKAWVLPVLGAGAVLWLAWRWWRRPPAAMPVNAALTVPAAAPRPDGIAALPWAGLLALAWPLLPAVWRGRISPAAGAAVISTGLLIVRRLVGRLRR